MLYAIWDDLTESWLTEPATREVAIATLEKGGLGGRPMLAGYGGEYTPLFGSRLLAAQKADKAEAERASKRAGLLASFGVPRQTPEEKLLAAIFG